MQLPEYDEYELIEVDHDEAQVLDDMTATQADEHWGLAQEQALLRDISKRQNVIYPFKRKEETNK